MKVLNKITILVGYLLIGISISIIPLFYLYSNNQNVFTWRLFSNQFADIGVAVSIGAFGLWISKKIFLEIRKRDIQDFGIIRYLIIFLRKHHVMIGWLAIFSTSAHGIYYILSYPNKQTEIVTGIITWGLLIILGGFGAFLDYKFKEKRKHNKIKVYHIVLSVIFMVGLIIHVL